MLFLSELSASKALAFSQRRAQISCPRDGTQLFNLWFVIATFCFPSFFTRPLQPARGWAILKKSAFPGEYLRLFLSCHQSPLPLFLHFPPSSMFYRFSLYLVNPCLPISASISCFFVIRNKSKHDFPNKKRIWDWLSDTNFFWENLASNRRLCFAIGLSPSHLCPNKQKLGPDMQRVASISFAESDSQPPGSGLPTNLLFSFPLRCVFFWCIFRLLFRKSVE